MSVRFRQLPTAALLLLTAYCTLLAAQTGVKGKVRDIDGGAINGATIEARQEGKVIRTATSDAKGQFVINLEPGVYNIAFDAVGYSTGVLYRVEVKRNNIRDLGGNLRMTRDRGTLVLVRGIVFDKNNLSVPGAVVDLYQVSGSSEKKLGTVYTNESGDFAFRGFRGSGTYRVKASYSGTSAAKDIEIDQPQVYRTAINIPYERPKAN